MPTMRVNNSGATKRGSEFADQRRDAHIERPGGDGDDDRPGQRREEIGRDPGRERDQREREHGPHDLAGAGVDRKRRPAAAIAGTFVRIGLGFCRHLAG